MQWSCCSTGSDWFQPDREADPGAGETQSLDSVQPSWVSREGIQRDGDIQMVVCSHARTHARTHTDTCANTYTTICSYWNPGGFLSRLRGLSEEVPDPESSGLTRAAPSLAAGGQPDVLQPDVLIIYMAYQPSLAPYRANAHERY